MSESVTYHGWDSLFSTLTAARAKAGTANRPFRFCPTMFGLPDPRQSRRRRRRADTNLNQSSSTSSAFDTRRIRSPIDFVCAPFLKINYYLPRIRIGADMTAADGSGTECLKRIELTVCCLSRRRRLGVPAVIVPGASITRFRPRNGSPSATNVVVVLLGVVVIRFSTY